MRAPYRPRHRSPLAGLVRRPAARRTTERPAPGRAGPVASPYPRLEVPRERPSRPAGLPGAGPRHALPRPRRRLAGVHAAAAPPGCPAASPPAPRTTACSARPYGCRWARTASSGTCAACSAAQVRVTVHVRPARRANRKPVLELHGAGGFTAFVKIGDTARVRDLVRHEAAVLRMLADLPTEVVSPPACCTTGVWRGMEVLVLSALPVPRPAAPPPRRSSPRRCARSARWRGPPALLAHSDGPAAPWQRAGERPTRADAPAARRVPGPTAWPGTATSPRGTWRRAATAAAACGTGSGSRRRAARLRRRCTTSSTARCAGRGRPAPPRCASRRAPRLLAPFGVAAGAARDTAAPLPRHPRRRHRRDGHEPSARPPSGSPRWRCRVDPRVRLRPHPVPRTGRGASPLASPAGCSLAVPRRERGAR